MHLRLLLSFALSSLFFVGCGDDDTDTDAATDTAPDSDASDTPEACSALSFTRIAAGGTGSESPDGIGGEGDLEVRNGTLRAVFSAVDRPSGIAASGGTLVDLHLLGQSDHMNELSQLAGADQAMQVEYTSLEVVEENPRSLVVEARGFVKPQPQEEGEEAVITPAPGENLAYITRYTFGCEERFVTIDSELRNDTETEYETSTASFAIMDVMLWGTRSLIPFCPARGQGDDCNEFRIEDPLPGLVESLYIGSTGSVVGDPGSFAFYLNDDQFETFIGVHSDQVSSFGFFGLSDDRMRAGQVRTLSRVVTVGDAADAASATDLALEGLAQRGVMEIATVTGNVALPAGETLSDDPFSRPVVILARPDGDDLDPERWTPLTMVRVAADGSFSANVPAGEVAWGLRVAGRQETRGAGGEAASGATLDLGTLEASSAAVVNVEVRDLSSGAPTSLPARVVFKGMGDTPDPNFGPYYGASPVANLAYTDGEGDLAIRVPPGDYEVYATHGPFFTIARQEVTVDADGADVTFTLSALDVVPEGMVSADFHVHSGASFDASLPLEDRVFSYIAEGVDAIVSTEHDVIFDYAPTLAQVEAELPPTWRGRLKTYVGLESTATVPQPEFIHTTGHHNVFPLTPQVGAHKNGAPQDEYLDVGTLYDRMRAVPAPADVIVQLNHARSGRDGSVWLGYFDSCGYDPSLPFAMAEACFGSMSTAGTRPYDFDLFEMLNGKTVSSFVQLQRDWFGLLLAAPGGRLPIATANSDSHELVFDQPGYPVTLIKSDGLSDAASMVAAVTTGAVAGAYGVVVWGSAREAGSADDGVEPGRDVLSATSVELSLRVAAAPWFPVEEVRVRIGGVVVATLDGADLVTPTDPYGAADVVRYEGVVDLSAFPVTVDSFITVDAGLRMGAVADLDGDGIVDATDNDGDGDIDEDDLPGGVDIGEVPMPLGVITPGGRPLGFMNPIFIDADGDGAYTGSGDGLAP